MRSRPRRSRRHVAALAAVLLALPVIAVSAEVGATAGSIGAASGSIGPALRLNGGSPGPVATADVADALVDLEWRNIGPAIMGGRVADLAVVEADPSTFYVGTATGGVWKTVNAGNTWEPIFDDQPTGSIGDVTVSQQNPNLIWVGSGEPQNRQSSPWGNGVYKSLDGGRTWHQMGLYETRHVSRIVIDPRDNDTVFVGAVGHLWGPNEERGVFRTRDGGATWEKVLYVDENTGVIDLAMDPGDPDTLFAAMYQRRRRGYGFNGGGPGSGIYRSFDGGDTWQELTEGLPEGDKGRIGLDIYRRDGNLVMALVQAGGGRQGVYKSTDRGDTWEHLSTTNNRPMYYSQIRIDPNDPDRVYLGGAPLFVSEDGGRNFRNDAARDVHSDHHALWIDPNDSDHLILAGDGGVSISRDRSATWRQLRNLVIAQFYEIGVDMREPYYVCGGLQDNGSWCGPSRTLSTLGIRNRDWYNVGSGDGFYVRIDADDHEIVFAESQGGNIRRVNLETGERQAIRPLARPQGGEPDSELDYRWNWNTPVMLSQHDSETLYVGSNHLLKSTDRGLTWEAISPDLTMAIDRDELEIMGVRVRRGQTLSAHDGISSYGNLTTISESPLDPGVLYAGTDDGNLQGTRDGGATWELLNQDVPGLPERTMVSRVVASRHDAGRVYATFDGHENDDYRPYVYVSSDYGRDWTPIVEGLPDDWSVNVIAEHPSDPDLLFLGNEVGVWFSIDAGQTWAQLKNNLPTVPVDDIVIHPRDNDLVLGTHGRGIWILDDISPLEELSEGLLEQPAHLFAVRDATLFGIYTPQEWSPGIWRAENPPYGAMIRYWLREDEPLPEQAEGEQEEQPEPGPGFGGGRGGGGGGRGQAGPPPPVEEPARPVVRLSILDSEGNLVRELEGPGEAGVRQAVWDLRIDPAFETPAGGGGFRGGRGATGPRVLPGTYTVRLEAAETAFETIVAVELDPRIEITRTELEARQRALMDAYHLARPLFEANLALQELGNQLDALRDLLDDDTPEELRDQAFELSRELRRVGQRLNEVRGGLGAANAIGSYTGPPTEDQLWQIEQAWDSVDDVFGEINGLIDRLPELIGRVYQPGFGPDPVQRLTIPTRPGG